MYKMHLKASLLLAMVSMGFLAGCKDKEEIQVYRVSKDDESTPAAGMDGAAAAASATPGMQAPAAPEAAAGDSGSGLIGTPPSSWEAQPPSAMRQASFLVKGDNGASADVSLVALGGAAGGTLENVNRWLTQLGQGSITEEQLKGMGQNITTPLGNVIIVDLQGLPSGADTAKDGRILGGIASNDANTYFFKMRGNAALVESEKEDFVNWVKSVHVPAGDESAAAPVAAAAPPVQAETGVDAQPQIGWTVPAGWTSTPPSAMRYASFTVAGQNGETADVSVSVLGGEAGGDLANVNRWRGQVGLEPVTDGDLKGLVTLVSAGGGDIMTVDMAGATSRILAGWAHVQGQTWFFKITGPDDLVSGQKENFVKFLKSVQFKS